MRIGCLQFAPHVGDVDNNLNRADAILNRANADDLDLLVLPEMAFTGYNFSSLQHISPFLEPTGAGITSVWARTTALKHNCKVLVGYPEASDVSRKSYNSVIMVNEDGETCAHYRKSHLYYTDKTWAQEGSGFFSGTIPGLGKVAMGICMDINPYDFVADEALCEFATHALEVGAKIVIVSMAWLTLEDPSFYCVPHEPDMETVSYWVGRLEPLIKAETEEEIIVIFGNRTGIEGNVVYAGTSAVLGIQRGVVTVYGWLGRATKSLLIVDTEKPGIGKLVYRPEEGKQKTDTPCTKPHMPTEHDSVDSTASDSQGPPGGTARSTPHDADAMGQSRVPGTGENTSEPRDSIRSHILDSAIRDSGITGSRRGRLSGEERETQPSNGRNRYQSEPGECRHRAKHSSLPSRADNDGVATYFRPSSLAPNLNSLGFDLTVLEEEWASRRKRDSLVCHVDEDDYVVLRKDTMSARKQIATPENDLRASMRHSVPQLQHASKARSRSASRTLLGPAIPGSGARDDDRSSYPSRRRARSDSAPAPNLEMRKGYHHQKDSPAPSPSARTPHRRHVRAGSSVTSREREVQFASETSPGRRRQRGIEMPLSTERTIKQSKPDSVTLPIRSMKVSNGERKQDYREGLKASVGGRIRPTPGSLNPSASQQNGANRSLGHISNRWGRELPPTPRAMVLPPEYGGKAEI